MLGYIKGEKYEDFFFRKHGFKHTEQSYESSLILVYNISIMYNIYTVYVNRVHVVL